MQRDFRALILLAGLIVALTGGGLWALAAFAPAAKQPAQAHTLFHIGCTHHSHGPAWHAGHGRSAGYQRPVGGAAAPEPVPVQSRALTAGR